ncbi:MAG: amino acid ABC transporter permease [Acutalibacteraceae bacterium]|nr:amino acid ABC transporter permease [Acutalibacteraceae bacterium]
MNYEVLLNEMLDGTLVSLEIFFLTLLFALPLGLILCLGRMSKHKVIQLPVKLYLLIMRGTPLMLQLVFIFYGLKPLFGIQVDRFPAAIIAFSLNYAAYFAEIFRSGMEGIPKGQFEASKVLGLSKSQTYFSIVLPQVVKRILPAMGNEFITLVKDTSLAKVISVVELMKVTTDFVNSAVSVVPFIVAALFYLIMNGIVTMCFGFAEKKLDYYR